MDPSWHHHQYQPPPPPPPPSPPPPLGGALPHATICPVCSIYHFPFCPPPFYPSGHRCPPPPHSTDQFYPRPPPPPQPYHQPPPPASAAPYDPFADHRVGPAINPNRTPADPWSSNPGFDRDPYAQVYLGYDHNNAASKRIRFDDSGFNTDYAGQPGFYKNDNPQAFSQFFSDDERRLKLIRDHGGAMNAKRNFFEPLIEAGINQPENIKKGQFGYLQPQADISLKRKNVYENGYHGAKQSQGLLGNDQFHRQYGVQNQIGPMQNHYEATYPSRQGFESRSSTGMGQDYQGNGQPSVHALPHTAHLAEPPRQHFPKGVVSSSPSGSFHSEQVLSTAYMSENEFIPARSQSTEKHRIFDASHIIKPPHRASRPDQIVIILRGLPGSGKSYLAKLLRDLEVEYGGSVPRIHSMDDYFMTEVEKEEVSEVSKSSGSVRGKKQSTKSVLEYCYEPEMEEAYRSSMLRAFKKTLDEGVFTFVIVDDRNLRVADFAQFWAFAKRSGYEVYLLEAPYKDPAGCVARNIHNFTQEEVQKMSDLWEEAPFMYFKLDVKSLLHADTCMESGIQEVDMDLEEGDPGCLPHGSVEENSEKSAVPREGDHTSDGPEDDGRLEGEADDYAVEKVKELGKSKWSNDLDIEDSIRNSKTEAVKAKSDSLSGLKKSYLKEGKSVRWGDEVGNSGFSISAAKTVNAFSLVIGPGSGYNSKSNPLPEEEKISVSRYMGESKKQNIFQEKLRAEHESFKAAFDNRRQRLDGLNGSYD